MNRIGLDTNDVLMTENVIRYTAENLNLIGLFTHLCVADTMNKQEFTKRQ